MSEEITVSKIDAQHAILSNGDGFILKEWLKFHLMPKVGDQVDRVPLNHHDDKFYGYVPHGVSPMWQGEV